jgi:hypothetical protein
MAWYEVSTVLQLHYDANTTWERKQERSAHTAPSSGLSAPSAAFVVRAGADPALMLSVTQGIVCIGTVC